MNNGYIKLFRNIQSWEYYKDIKIKTLYIHLILNVAFAEYEKDGYKIHKGTIFTSIRKLSEETGLTVREVRTALATLETTQQLTQTATHKGTLIKLINTAFLEGQQETTTQQLTQETTHETTQYNNKNIHKNFNKNIHKNKAASGGDGEKVIKFNKNNNWEKRKTKDGKGEYYYNPQSFNNYEQRHYDYKEIEKRAREKLFGLSKSKKEETK